MEQYRIPKELDFENLRFVLDNYKPTSLLIRPIGSSDGTKRVREQLENRTLDFEKNESGLYMLIDSQEVFHFPLKLYYKGFLVRYERINSEGVMILLSCGIDPYDPNKPKPETSTLRAIFDNHLMQVDFDGMVDLKFHSWLNEPYSKYWTIDEPRNKGAQ